MLHLTITAGILNQELASTNTKVNLIITNDNYLIDKVAKQETC